MALDERYDLRSEDVHDMPKAAYTPPIKRLPRLLKVNIAVLISVLVIIAAFLIFAFRVKESDKIYPNIYTLGVKVGGLTREEAAKAIADSGFDKYAGKSINVRFEGFENADFTITSDELGITLDPMSFTQAPFEYGRGGNLIKNAITYIKCLFVKTEIEADTSVRFGPGSYMLKIKNAAAKIERPPQNPVLTTEGNTVTITKGVSGLSCDVSQIAEQVIESFRTMSFEDVIYTPIIIPPEEASFNHAFEMVHRDAQNSVYSAELGDFTEEITGVSFDLEAANEALRKAGEGESVTVYLYEIEPNVKKADLEGLLFRDVLSESVTPLTPIPNRTNNIEIAASLINEVIVEPGEVFSFNSYVGPYTEEAGFKLAAAYSDGEVVQELGGGVCQVASALYYCSIYSNLEIVYRTCHLYVPSYIEYGLDATVSYDSVDYRFKNNTGYPIKILASVEGDELHVSFVGTNLSGNYVETETNIVREVPYDTVYVTDESLSEGESYHVTYGFTGYQVDVYRLLYNKDGTLLLRSFENESIYSSRDEVIAVAP